MSAEHHLFVFSRTETPTPFFIFLEKIAKPSFRSQFVHCCLIIVKFENNVLIKFVKRFEDNGISYRNDKFIK